VLLVPDKQANAVKGRGRKGKEVIQVKWKCEYGHVFY